MVFGRKERGKVCKGMGGWVENVIVFCENVSWLKIIVLKR